MSNYLHSRLITYFLCLNSLFFLISSQQATKKTIFDETNLKYLKVKNRVFRGSVGDLSFHDGKISEEGFKLYDDLSKNEIGIIFTGYTTVSDYDQLIMLMFLDWIRMNIYQNIKS